MLGEHAARPYGPDGCYINSSYSFVIPNLYIGGLAAIATLPQDIGKVDTLAVCAQELCVQDVSGLGGSFGEVLKFPLRDSEKKPIPAELINEAALTAIVRLRARKSVLVICSQGINRSAVVVAKVLYGLGYPDPIPLLREQRHPCLLSNRAFEGWITGMVQQEKVIKGRTNTCQH